MDPIYADVQHSSLDEYCNTINRLPNTKYKCHINQATSEKDKTITFIILDQSDLDKTLTEIKDKINNICDKNCALTPTHSTITSITYKIGAPLPPPRTNTDNLYSIPNTSQKKPYSTLNTQKTGKPYSTLNTPKTRNLNSTPNTSQKTLYSTPNTSQENTYSTLNIQKTNKQGGGKDDSLYSKCVRHQFRQ